MDKSGNLARASRQLENLMGDRRLVSAVIPLITGLLWSRVKDPECPCCAATDEQHGASPIEASSH